MECDVCQPSGNIEGAGKTTICNACTETIERHVREVLLREEEEGGYNTNLFVDSPSDQYLCPICLQVHKQPMQVVGCGHVYCMQCLNTATRGQEEKICPFCREGFEFAINDMSMKRMVMALKIKCKNEGCQWIGDLFDLQPHLEKDCKYLLINCTSDRCEVNVEKRNLITHLIEECPFLRVKCSLCRIFICSSTKELSEHKMICNMRPLKCSYSHLGCTFEGSKDCMNDHVKTDVSIHLALSTEDIGKLKQQNIDNDQQVKIQELELKINDLQISNSDLKDKYRVIQEENADLKSKLDDKVRLLNQRDSALQSKLDKMRNENNKILQEHNMEIALLKQTNEVFENNKCLISNQIDGEFIWIIDDFKQKFQASKNKGEELYSPVFVTKLGYHCKLNAILNGYGDGQNSHLSLFFIMVKGPLDAILKWPFPHNVKLSIVSQGAITENSVVSFNLSAPNLESCFQRPIGNENVGSGKPRFVSHTEILQSFVKDDVMFIKCTFS